MKYMKTLMILFFITLLTVGCSSAEDASSSKQDSELTIYTSVYPFKYVVEQLAGDTATVKTVFPPGTDAHTYEPTSKDIIDIANSDAFIYLGAGMEGFSESIAESLGSQNVKLIEMGKYDELFHSGHSHEEHHEHEESGEITIEITGLSDHYHTDSSINLSAVVHGTEHDHLHWYTLNPDEEDWVVVEGQSSNSLNMKAEVDGQQIKAVIYGEDHEVVAESEPVTIKIDDHEGDHEHGEEGHDHEGDHGHGEEGHDHAGEHEHEDESHDHGNNNESVDAEIEGLSGHYHTGDSINLTANIDEAVTYDHVHWFILNPDGGDWTVVDGQTSNEFESVAEVDGQQIKAVFYGDNHEVVLESEPVIIEIDDHEGDHDPHIWIDPLRMVQIAQILKDQLIELNPEEEELYNENFKALEEKLLDLNSKFTELLSTKENKSIIVSHAAFGYWEERYGIHQIAIHGLSTADEPSQKQITEIINQSEEHNLEYVLFEQNSSNKLTEVIQKEIGAKPLTIHNLSVLTQEDIDNEEDYISLMEYNLEVLNQATK